MGYIRHHAIIVTTWGEWASRAARYARECGAIVIGPHKEPTINSYKTLCIVPDGSKEDWMESETGNRARSNIKDWLRDESRQEYYEWCEIAYSDDDGKSEIIDDSWKERQDER